MPCLSKKKTEREIMNRDFCPRNNCILNNRFGVQEAPGLLKEGGGVMKKIQSESLSQKLPAVIKKQYPAFLNNGSIMVASCSSSRGRGFSDA
jgi:hypothetical protein